MKNRTTKILWQYSSNLPLDVNDCQSILNIIYHTLIDFPHPKFWEHFKTVNLYLKGQKTNKTSNNKHKLKAQTNILEHKRLVIV